MAGPNEDGTSTSTKVVGVGMHKTGTKSLASALRTLGYRVTGPFGIDDPSTAREALPRALEILRDFDAAQDNPWPFLYRELDAAFPGSKFILTHRDPDEWIESVVRHFGGKSTPMREWIYGVGDPIGNEDRYVDVYQQHNREVRDYFQGRTGSFMTLEVGVDRWPALCGFLDHPEPSTEFPHANSSQQRKESRRLTRRLARVLTG